MMENPTGYLGGRKAFPRADFGGVNPPILASSPSENADSVPPGEPASAPDGCPSNDGTTTSDSADGKA